MNTDIISQEAIDDYRRGKIQTENIISSLDTPQQQFQGLYQEEKPYLKYMRVEEIGSIKAASCLNPIDKIRIAAGDQLMALASVARLLKERQQVAKDLLRREGEDDLRNLSNMILYYNEKINAILGL